jgi:hypothetical protein
MSALLQGFLAGMAAGSFLGCVVAALVSILGRKIPDRT